MSSRYGPFYILLLLFVVFGLVQAANNLPAQAEGGGFDCTNVTEIPQIECEALVALYDSTNGDNWEINSGWLETNTPCAWYGVFCFDGHVSRLRVFGNQLSGVIPPALGSLNHLIDLSLQDNQLTGTIPPELGDLTDLVWLFLASNQLSGSIPPELGNLANLRELYLDRNQLSGSIPPELSNLTNLRVLFVYLNQLTGPIPPELGNLTNFVWLNLSQNQLSGTIPIELINLTNLTYLTLAENQLSGTIPPELENLTNLTRLHLHLNQLTGAIPAELGNLTNLTELDLNRNQLSGTIPPELGNLTNLTRLSLFRNQLSGPIPPELGNLTNMAFLSLAENQLSGTIPPELGDLTDLWLFHLHLNQLNGNIPSELGDLTNLTELYLNRNQLSGAIPPELGNLTGLTRLSLSSNQLNGPLPLSFVDLVDLSFFEFHHTNLCEPPDPAFQQWISNIPEVYGTDVICEHTPPPQCQQANPDNQPLLLVTGWPGSRPSAAQDDQLHFFFGDDGHLAPYDYVEGCNLFYAQSISAHHWLDDNAHAIRDNLCDAYTQVKAFNPNWNGRFDIIGHSYGGLAARAYLENPDLYGQHCAGGQNVVYVDNLFSLGTPHGGEPFPSGLIYDLLPGAALVGLEGVSDFQLPALVELSPLVRTYQNKTSSQAAGTCYYLLSGDARSQSQQFPSKLRTRIGWFPKTYLVANDLTVDRNSVNVISGPFYIKLYPRTILINTPDVHGHVPEDWFGPHNLRSFVNPNTTFVEEIWPNVGRRVCSPSTPTAASPLGEPTPIQLSKQHSQLQTTAGIPMMDITAGSLNSHETTSGSFVLSGTGASQIVLSWVEGDLALNLVDPDGTPIDPTTVENDSNVDYFSFNTGFGLMATYLITDTINGVWQYTIASEEMEQPTGYRLVALPPTPIAVSPSAPQWLPNNTPVVITATVSYSQTEPVTGGEVAARIRRPDGIVDIISLYDDGEHDDGQADSGVFGGVYTQTTTGGIYGVLVTATGVYESEVFTRTATANFAIAPNGAALSGAYSDSGIDETGDGLYEWLELTADITVTEAATYTLSVELYAGEIFITHARQKMHLEVGQQTVPVRFAGPAIFEAGLDGPYTIRNVMLLEESPMTLLIEMVDNVHITQAYWYTDFGHHRLYLPIALRQ
jgi:Leucine-rich repeat (LRR) protein/pimeloyl-ACP methyl ester carboxylesterase